MRHSYYFNVLIPSEQGNVSNEEDSNGLLHYDYMIDAIESAAFDDVSLSKRSQNHKSWHLDSSTSDEMLSENNEQSSGMVFNLFIEGEDIEITPQEPAQPTAENNEIDTEIESLKLETDYKVFLSRLEALGEKVDSMGLMDKYEPQLNELADMLTGLLRAVNDKIGGK